MDGLRVRQNPTIASSVPPAWQIVGVADLDGDHKADLSSGGTRKLATWRCG